MANNFVYPGDTIGIINNDVNTRALMSEALKNGLRIGLYTDNSDDRINTVTDFTVSGSLQDHDRIKEFAEQCDLVVYNTVRTDANLVNFLGQYTKVPQGVDILEIMNDRLIEQTFLNQLNVNTLPYVTIVELNDIYKSIDSIGFPAILKPIQKAFFNDQQLIINNQVDIAKAALMLDRGTYLLEPYIEHDFEYTLNIVNGMKDEPKLMPIVRCQYRGATLQTVTNLNELPGSVVDEMNRIGRLIAKNLNYYGAFKIIFLVNQDQNIYIKAVTPKLGIESMIFDREVESIALGHLRAVCGQPTSSYQVNGSYYLKTFTQDQLPAVKRQWALKPDWQFVFYSKVEDEHGAIGHVLIPTDSLTDTLEQIKNTEIWQ